MNITLLFGEFLKTRSIASSDMIVLPEPVGAPISTFESVWYRVWKTCVCTGLKNLNLLSYNASNFGSPSVWMDSGRSGYSFVFGKSSSGTSSSDRSIA